MAAAAGLRAFGAKVPAWLRRGRRGPLAAGFCSGGPAGARQPEPEPGSRLTSSRQRDGIRNIVLSNPKRRNALSLAMLKSLRSDILHEAESKDLKVIIISAEGPVFSSGHDLKELTDEQGPEHHSEVFQTCAEVMMLIQNHPVPVIAMVNGLATAAGCQLVASCDIAVASDKSSFATPGVNIGLFCSTPGVALGRAVPRKVSPGHLREKYSSCNTMYVDYSISQPDLRTAVQCLALAIYYNIKNRSGNRSKDIFEERLHPVTEEKFPEEFFHHNPDPDSIYKFIRPFFIAYDVTAGYAITTLIYIERLLIYAEIDLCPSNWKRIVLEAIIQAYKYLHDVPVWNCHFSSLIRGPTIKDLNELERQYLGLLRFRLYISASVYAQYYFDLRSLASNHGLPIVPAPLQKERGHFQIL